MTVKGGCIFQLFFFFLFFPHNTSRLDYSLDNSFHSLLDPLPADYCDQPELHEMCWTNLFTISQAREQRKQEENKAHSIKW